VQRRALLGPFVLASVILGSAVPVLAANPSLTLTPNHGTATRTFSARVTILGALVIGSGIWFALRGDRAAARADDSPPPPSSQP
jgi:hypothetical protein